MKGEYRRIVTLQLQTVFAAGRFVKAELGGERGDARGCAHATLNTTALVGPTEVRPSLGPLPLCSRGERASRSYAVLDGRLSHAAEFASIFRGRALRLSFFLLVRWCPPLRGES
jgi:hypothetical protein